MKQRTTKFRIFTIADFKDEEKFLSEQHALGWKLISVRFPGFYTFEKCEKEEYIYQLDFPDLENHSKRDYIRMFEDCGWEYLFDFVQFSYFRMKKDKHKEQEIFTDEVSKIEMINKIYKRRMLPILIIFCSIIIPNILYTIRFHTGAGIVIPIVFSLIVFLYILLIIHCGVKLNDLKKEIEK